MEGGRVEKTGEGRRSIQDGEQDGIRRSGPANVLTPVKPVQQKEENGSAAQCQTRKMKETETRCPRFGGNAKSAA